MIEVSNNSHYRDVGPILRRTLSPPGRFPVGICHYHAVDPARTDKHDKVPRQFMMSAFYPCETRKGTVAARFVDLFEPVVDEALAYVTAGADEKAREKFTQSLRSIGMQAARGGLPLRSSAPFPTLIYYPAGECNRFANVDVCEGLTSHGYVVFAVDGPHDAPIVVFPDGHMCRGPLRGDYISPGVGDVGYLISQLDELNRDGFLAGMIDTERVGIFGHSRGGYIANITAFLHDQVKAAASIDCFLWGYMSKGSGLERHSKEFQVKVRSTSKPLLRMCGRPADTDPRTEAEFCLKRDGGDFVGDFTVVAFPGWSHGDFATTPWLCGRGNELLANQSRERVGAAETLTDILTAFFNVQLLGEDPDQLTRCIRRHPALGIARQAGA